MGLLQISVGRIKLKSGYEKKKISFGSGGFVHRGITYVQNPKKMYRATYLFLFTLNSFDYTEGIPEPCDFYRRRLPLFEYIHKDDYPDGVELDEKLVFDSEGYLLDDDENRVVKTDESGKAVYRIDRDGNLLLGGELVEYDDDALTPNVVGDLLLRLAHKIKNFEYYMLGGLAIIGFISVMLYRSLGAIANNIQVIITTLNDIIVRLGTLP